MAGRDAVTPPAGAEEPPRPREFTFESPLEADATRALTFEIAPPTPPPGPEGRVSKAWKSAADDLAVGAALLAAPRNADVEEGARHMLQLAADPPKTMEMMIRSAIVRSVGFRTRAMEYARLGDLAPNPVTRARLHRDAIAQVREVRAEEDRILRLLAKRERYMRDHRWDSKRDGPVAPESAEKLNEAMDHVTAAAVAAFSRMKRPAQKARGA